MHPKPSSFARVTGGTIMRRFSIVSTLLVVVVGVTAGAVLAAINVKSLPTATFSGASVTLTNGNFSGLGSTPAFGTLTVEGQATYTCTNKGGNAAPGQNPVPAQGGSSGPFDLGNSTHNGRGDITGATASVEFPPTPTAQQVGCGGGGSTSWTVTPNTLIATTANLTVTQSGSIIFCRNYVLGGSSTGTAC
jgi:hypothetical protein